MTFNKNTIYKDQGGERQTFPSGSTQRIESGAIINSAVAQLTSLNVGTVPAGVIAIEHGDGFNHTTILTLAGLAAVIGDNASLALGELIYTPPAGALLINSAYMSIAITAADTVNDADTPEVGLGTVIGSGANATLGAVGATSENIMLGQVAANISGTATVKTVEPTAGAPLVIEVGDAHAVFLNYADGWANVTTTAVTISGTVVLNWQFMA